MSIQYEQKRQHNMVSKDSVVALKDAHNVKTHKSAGRLKKK